MSITWPIESAYGKEIARWNTPRNRYLEDSNGELLKDLNGSPIRGENCVGYEEYPRLLYRAQRLPNGQPSVGEIPPHPGYGRVDYQEYEQQIAFVDQFNRGCWREVKSEKEERIAKGQGWCRTTQEALDLYEREQQAIARAAAEAEYAVRRMSPAAQAEWREAQDASSEHVVDVGPPPRRPVGRPKKAVAVAPMATSPGGR